MTHVVLASTPVQGHVLPLRAVAADLVKRGYDVTFATGSIFREMIEEVGARFVPFSGLADYDATRMYEAFPGLVGLDPGIEQLNYYVEHLFIATIPDQHRVLQKLLADAGNDPTVVIHESTFAGMWPVMLGGPGIRPAGVISVGISPVPVSSEDTAPFGMGLPPDSSPAGKERNRKLNAIAKDGLRTTADAMTRVLGEFAITAPLPYYFDGQVVLTDAYLQLSVPGLDYPRSDAPVQLRHIGALPASNSDRPLPSWFPEVLDAERVVLLSQGTVANADFSELIRPGVDALADLDALVVVTTVRENDDLGPVPANTRIARYIPYEKLLPHVDAVVSNGGFGITQQTLSHGVPMVLAGETEDKKEVTAVAAYSGAAINLETSRPTKQALRKAVDELLHDKRYRDAARRLQVEYASYEPFDAIANTLEEFARTPRHGLPPR